ncbi:MAG TPA: Gfo/Idh/MocA family oxidoreductase [Verrucomicrobiota bacterium]|nr:Gfo/Idh/MocA family oxidoreductase [Verrucomicrobiota bacterium]
MNTPGKSSRALSRRDFIRTTTFITAAIAAPLIIPSRLLGADAPSNKIRVGHIGCGRIALSHDMTGVANSGLADSLAVCDVDSKRVAQGKATIERLYRDRPSPAPKVDTYGDYRELLARTDIDAVTISTPDHWHAEIALAAIKAGKDVYLQKPMTMTYEEGVLLRDAVVKSGRIFQLGSQQRSWGPNEQFRKACEFVRSGRVGQLQRVEIGLPTDPTAPDDPQQPVPPNLNYDMWLGPTPEVYYTEQRVHSQTNVGSRPGWLRNDSYCLGMITGWGAHHFDTAHWGMDAELSGPSKVEGKGEFPRNKIWNVHGAYQIELLYSGNVRMTVSDKFPNGIKFIGDEGWIFVSRDAQTATSSDPTGRATPLKSLDASNEKLLDPRGVTVRFQHSTSHHKNWLECVKSRQTPLSPAPVAYYANAACIVSWIAMKLGRPLNWDATTGRFVNDDKANAMLSRPERAPYGAVRLAKA